MLAHSLQVLNKLKNGRHPTPTPPASPYLLDDQSATRLERRYQLTQQGN